MSGEMQSILRILGDIQAQNAEIGGRMERLEAEMEASKAAASRIETKVDSKEDRVLSTEAKVDSIEVKVDTIEVKVNALDWRALAWRRLDWSSLPHDTRKGALTYLSTEDSMGLNYAMTNQEARPHFIKSYKGTRIPAFDKLLYTEKDDFRVLRWVMEKGIDLQERLILRASRSGTNCLPYRRNTCNEILIQETIAHHGTTQKITQQELNASNGMRH